MNELTLHDYQDFIKDNLNTEELKTLADNCECSISTLYNYLGGKHSSKYLAKGILEEGLKMLTNKGISYNDQSNISI